MPEPFTQDEFLVILDHYLMIKDGSSKGAIPLPEKLAKLAAIPAPADPEHHRTSDGLRNVLGRFAAVDPSPPASMATIAARFADQALTAYHEVWNQYASDPESVCAQASALLTAASPTPASPVAASNPFELGRVYNRQQEIHGVYGGQKYGGIATPTAFPLMLIFSGEEGAEFGYADEELPGGGLLYCGEGQSGDMQMTKGNKAIRDHEANGKGLHLFKKVSDGFVQYAGEYRHVDNELRPDTPDGDGLLRTAIAFRLAPLGSAAAGSSPEIDDAEAAVRAIAKGQGFSQKRTGPDRKAIEMRAMKLATEHFAAKGYTVEDVSAKQPFDLRATKGAKVVDVR